MVAFTYGDDITGMTTSNHFKRKRGTGVSPGKDDITPEDRRESMVKNGAIMYAPIKRPRCFRYRKQKIESKLNDSGFEEYHITPSPSPSSGVTRHCPGSEAHTPGQLLTDWQNFMEYGESCFNTQKNNEVNFIPINCLARQPQVTAEARCKLVSWLIPVHRRFKLSFESCCLAVNIMDRFLSTTPVAADCFQLLGVTSLLIASKLVEVYSPQIKQLLALCCDAFTKDQLCNLECIVLIRLNFRLSAPTLAFFLDHYANHRVAGWDVGRLGQSRPETTAGTDHGVGKEDPSGGGDGEETLKPNPACAAEESVRRSSSCDAERSRSLARRICELSLADYAFSGYPPSVLAQCAVRLAERLLGPEPPGDQDQDHQEDQDQEDQECADNLRLLVSLNGDVLHTMVEL